MICDCGGACCTLCRGGGAEWGGYAHCRYGVHHGRQETAAKGGFVDNHEPRDQECVDYQDEDYGRESRIFALEDIGYEQGKRLDECFAMRWMVSDERGCGEAGPVSENPSNGIIIRTMKVIIIKPNGCRDTAIFIKNGMHG